MNPTTSKLAAQLVSVLNRWQHSPICRHLQSAIDARRRRVPFTVRSVASRGEFILTTGPVIRDDFYTPRFRRWLMFTSGANRRQIRIAAFTPSTGVCRTEHFPADVRPGDRGFFYLQSLTN